MNQISQSVYAKARVAAKETNDSCSGIQATGGIRERISNVNQCGDNSFNTPRQEGLGWNNRERVEIKWGGKITSGQG